MGVLLLIKKFKTKNDYINEIYKYVKDPEYIDYLKKKDNSLYIY